MSSVRRRGQRPHALRGHRVLLLQGLFPPRGQLQRPLLMRPELGLRGQQGLQEALPVLPLPKVSGRGHEGQLRHDRRGQAGEEGKGIAQENGEIELPTRRTSPGGRCNRRRGQKRPGTTGAGGRGTSPAAPMN